MIGRVGGQFSGDIGRRRARIADGEQRGHKERGRRIKNPGIFFFEKRIVWEIALFN